MTIHQGDFLRYRLPHSPYKVFANIPFSATAAIVARLTGGDCAPEDAYLAMQREAAEVLLGEPRASLRAMQIQPWFETEVVHRFKRTDFAPVPRVDVVMLRLRKRGPPLVNEADRQRFLDFIVYGFTTWRPSLGDTLKDLFTGRQLKRIQGELGVDLRATPTAISSEQWLGLFECFQKLANEQALGRILGSERRLARQQGNLQKIHRTRAHVSY